MTAQARPAGSRSPRFFQRTAQWVAPQENPAYTEEEKAALRRDPQALRTMAAEMTRVFHETFSNGVVDASSEQMRNLEKTCRDHLEAAVQDPVLREKLPNYRAACKRLVMSPDFYQAIQRPNARLVTDPIERVEAGGVRTRDGRLHALVVLVLATGFRVDRFVRRMRVIGRDGVDLDALWRDGPFAHLAISVPGFPNFFLLNGPNGPVGSLKH